MNACWRKVSQNIKYLPRNLTEEIAGAQHTGKADRSLSLVFHFIVGCFSVSTEEPFPSHVAAVAFSVDGGTPSDVDVETFLFETVFRVRD